MSPHQLKGGHMLATATILCVFANDQASEDNQHLTKSA